MNKTVTTFIIVILLFAVGVLVYLLVKKQKKKKNNGDDGDPTIISCKALKNIDDLPAVGDLDCPSYAQLGVVLYGPYSDGTYRRFCLGKKKRAEAVGVWGDDWLYYPTNCTKD